MRSTWPLCVFHTGSLNLSAERFMSVSYGLPYLQVICSMFPRSEGSVASIIPLPGYFRYLCPLICNLLSMISAFFDGRTGIMAENILIAMILCLFALSSCRFLDGGTVGIVDNDRMFENEQGFIDAMNGCMPR